MTYTVGSLFSGIGGLDLGLERARWTVRWQSEIDSYCSRVLAKHWPEVPNLGDVKTIDWSDVERVDLICGGYPCQPFSSAGSRRGTDDARHLWPYMRDAIGVLRPRLALMENVPGHLSLGFGDVLGDLAELGYDAEWDCIPAAALGAPHLRYRVFIVAHANGDGYGKQQDARRVGRMDGRNERAASERERSRPQPVDRSAPRLVAHSNAPICNGSTRDQTGRDEVHADERLHVGRLCALADSERQGLEGRSRGWSRRPQFFSPAGREGPGGEWLPEPSVGRVAHGVPSRVDRLRGLGNAVVPQVAEFIGEQLLSSLRAEAGTGS